MSTLRVSNIEAKADVSSPSVHEKIKVTNSEGDVLVHIDGATSGISTVGINTTVKTFDVDSNQNIDFVGDLTAPNITVTGTLTYEDVTSIDSVGVVTARNGLHVTGGSVGIGTDNPLRKLDILGTGRPVEIGSTNATNIVKLYNSATGRSTYNGVDIQSNSTAGGIISAYGGYLDLRTSSSNGSDATSRLLITSDGKVAIGFNAPAVAGLSISNSSTNRGFEFDTGSGFDSTSCIRAYDRPTTAYKSLGLTGSDIKFGINDVEKVRISSNGAVCIGSGYQSTGGGQLTIRGLGVNSYAVQDYQYVGTPSSNNTLSQIRFTANTSGSSVIGGARIQAAADADWSATGDAPTRLQFYTAPNGSASQLERLRITSDGDVLIADTTNSIYDDSTGGGMNLKANGQLILKKQATSTADPLMWLNDTGQTTNKFILFAQDGTEKASIGLAGNDLRFAREGYNETLRITSTTASVSSTGSGANGVGCVGMNDGSPASNALALSLRGTYGMEDPRPLVYLQRSYGVGGGSSTDEITLEIDAPGSYNSAGVVYGIKSFVRHNLNGSHYAGHFEGYGSQYSANGTSALYAKTTKLDTNGMGDVIAFRADASITTGIANNGAAIAGYFASGNNINGKPIVCQNGYTTNSYSNQIIFRKHNGSSIVDVGSIKSNNTATQYNTSSDYRLKENIVSLTGAIDRLKQLQPKRFNFIGIDETIDGFIAHEVNPVAPYAVSGEKDAVKKELVLDEDGKEQFDEDGEIIHREVIDPQGVDYSKLITLTIAALQEALAKIETLEAKVAVLEG